MICHNCPKALRPHNDKALELGLAGEKPLSIFSDLTGPDTVLPTVSLAPHVASGAITMAVFNEILPGGRTFRHEFSALPGEEWRIQFAYELMQTK
jgi:hypothetical protein